MPFGGLIDQVQILEDIQVPLVLEKYQKEI